ncbi:MAG: hypothetical protein LUO93_09265 [Methanomicrobiales archaeon]|nr:hypothetical protein [Methanomicrobiales archaeon]
MHHRWILLFLVSGLAVPVSAQDGIPAGILGSLDYGVIAVAGIIFLLLFFVGLNRIFKHAGTEIHGSSVIYALGMLVAYLCIAAGSLLIISSMLILIAIGAKMSIFNWLIDVLSLYIPWGGVTVGILFISGGGFALFLLGVYGVVHLYGTPFLNPLGVPTRRGSLSKYEQNGRTELEPLNPTLTFKVMDREQDDPVMDVKVILKQMNGTRYYTKYTDFDGEVTFRDIQGYGSEYFAYVEDDEKREKFRVLRKKSID